MKPPKVPPNFCIPDLPSFTDRFTKVNKPLRNVYGFKDAGKTWFYFLKKVLMNKDGVHLKLTHAYLPKMGSYL